MKAGNDDSPTVRRRLKAGQMLLAGMPTAEVARVAQLTVGTVRRYRNLVQSGGIDALRQLSVGGRVSSLNPDALDWIARALRQPATVYGFPTAGWTSSRLRDALHSQFGVSYSRVYAWQLATKLGLADRLNKSTR
jgi:transposase